jgi:hypothetical protein
MHLLTLVAALGMLICGFSYQRTGAAEPTGSIKVEVKGTMVCKGIGKAYISVRDKDNEETQVWFWESEGRWKVLRDELPKLDGQEVTVRGQIRQLPANSSTSIPANSLYFTAFEIETKSGEKIRR